MNAMMSEHDERGLPSDSGGGSRLDQLLDLLADEVADRLEARTRPGAATEHGGRPAPSQEPLHTQEPPPPGVYDGERAPVTSSESAAWEGVAEPIVVAPEPPEPGPILAPDATDDTQGRPSHAARLLARLLVGLVVVVVAINVPFNRHGTTLATALPGSASLVIKNGLLVKESDKPEIWLYRDDAFHWVSSLDAFEYYGYRWQDVHIVEPGYLAAFETGAPVHVLLKCGESPHIYVLENDHKRWIVDIPTLTAEGYVWEDVKTVSCAYLRSLPDGESIPPGRGTPGPPLP